MTAVDDSLGFALLGCGRIAVKHARILADGMVDGARMAAVCDIRAEPDTAVSLALGERLGPDLVCPRTGERYRETECGLDLVD